MKRPGRTGVLYAYMSMVTVVGVAALVAAALSFVTPSQADMIVLTTLFVLATAARVRPIHISLKQKFTPVDIATFAAALTLSPFFAMLVAGGSAALAQLFADGRARVPPSWRPRLFNVAATALACGSASAVYHAFVGNGDLLDRPAAILAAAVVKYLVHTLIVDVAVAIQMRRDPARSWWPVHRRDLVSCAILYGFGFLAAYAVSWSPWAPLVFILPMAFAMIAARETARVRADTRRVIVELADIIDMRDPYTHGHSQRVAVHAERCARRLGMQASQVELVRDAARVHDIGKIGTPDAILRKAGPLDPEEFAIMKEHAELTRRILVQLSAFWEGAFLASSHHERYDGHGYPSGRSGSEIPLEVAAISVADAYDAMTSDRSYRNAMPWEAVRAELERGSGTQFHPTVVAAFVELIEEERRSADVDGAATAAAEPVPARGAAAA